MRGLDGKVAIITGGAMAMGAATAELFASCGSRIVVADLNEELGRAVARKIVADGGEAIFAKVDATRSEQVSDMVKAAVTRARASGRRGQQCRGFTGQETDTSRDLEATGKRLSLLGRGATGGDRAGVHVAGFRGVILRHGRDLARGPRLHLDVAVDVAVKATNTPASA